MIQPKSFYNIFKREISLERQSSDKLTKKNRSKKKKIISKEKNKLNTNYKDKNKNNKSSRLHIEVDTKAIYSDKNIIINDITNNCNIHSAFKDKMKRIKIAKLNNGDNSTDQKYFRFKNDKQETNDYYKMNNTISDFKLNKSNIVQKKNKSIYKSSINDKIIMPIEINKIKKTIINNKNPKNKKGFGDSYEFNFTFNNYNNNVTQNNYNNTEQKNLNKINEKNELVSNKTVIKDFSSVKNKIFNDIKETIINSKNKKSNKKEKLKIEKIGVIRKNKEKNNTNDIYAIIIQKIFRGYIYRKKHKTKRKKNSKEKNNSNSGIYIKKKILNKKSVLNININDNLSYFKNDYHFTENNLTQARLTENNKNNETQANKIEEIIIDKSKLKNVLGPSTKTKDSRKVTINSGYNFGEYK